MLDAVNIEGLKIPIKLAINTDVVKNVMFFAVEPNILTP